MALQLAVIVDSISKISVTGLEVLDIDQVPATVDIRKRVLMPLADFVTDLDVTRDSFGAGDAKMTVVYRLHYRLFYEPAGGLRITKLESLPGLLETIGKVWDAVLALDTLPGAVDIVPADITNMGIVNDPSDSLWYGCDLGFYITEFVN